jgi:hypothetical protein
MLRVVKAPFAAARLSRDLNELFFRHDSISALLVQVGLLLSVIMYFIGRTEESLLKGNAALIIVAKTAKRGTR